MSLEMVMAECGSNDPEPARIYDALNAEVTG